MNAKLPLDNLPPNLLHDPAPPDALGREKSLSDRILAYAFAASVVVNFGWIFWVAHSDIFGGSVIPPTIERQIKVYKRPLPPKPKPPKVKPPPPPPPPKPQPHMKPPPPLHLTHTPPPRPQPHVQQVRVAQTHSELAPPRFTVPDVPTPPSTPAVPAVPSYTPPPVEKAPVADVPPTPAPPKQADPTPAPPEHHDPPPAPPKPAIPDRDEPELVVGSFTDLNLPNFDPSTISVTQITVTWEVDERGRPKSIHLSPRTSGNSEVDDAIREAVGKYRYRPAVHNGVPEAQQVRHTFTLGN